MSRFSRNAGKLLLAKYGSSRALERRGLRHIHSESSLDELAIHLASYLGLINLKAALRVESVWVDGTPQAVAATSHGQVQCELADLLIVLNVVRRGALDQRIAVLVQEKVSAEPGVLPAGESSKKERLLLEHFDDSQKLELYRDTKASSKIGAYDLKGVGTGLKKHCRYLAMLFQSTLPVAGRFGPFTIGWPRSMRTHVLGDLEHFRDIPILMWESKVGSPMTSRTSDEWTRLVEDLLGQYNNKRMKRFGGFDRVSQSNEAASFVRFSHMSPLRWPNNSEPPYPTLPAEAPEGVPPSISTISVVVDIDPEEVG